MRCNLLNDEWEMTISGVTLHFATIILSYNAHILTLDSITWSSLTLDSATIPEQFGR